MDSTIATDEKGKCFVCGTHFNIQEHHIFEGSCRQMSEQYGLKVHLCLDHHTGYHGVHTARGKQLRECLHKIGQTEYMDRRIQEGMTEEEALQDFRDKFIRSYL